MARKILYPILCAAALLAGCDPKCARLPGGMGYCLQDTEGVAPFEIQQKIELAFDGRNETMIAQLEVDAAGMRLAILTPLGQSLLRAGFDHGEIHAEGIALQKLDPAFLLAMIQLAYWDAARLRQHLDGLDELVESETGRTFVKEGKTILRIGYPRGRSPTGDVRIELPGMGVAFRMTTLPP